MKRRPYTKNVYVKLLLAVLLSFSQGVKAQKISDTLGEFQLKRKKATVISSDSRIQLFSPGQKITSIDSQTLERYKLQSIANLLSQQTPVFVKSYGLNGLATLNFRGSSAAQSQVYWNGVPIQNAALGIADISTLPVAMVNRVNLVYGSSSALLGSGNVGGALMLETEQAVFDTNKRAGYSLSAGAGSFAQYQLGLKITQSSSKWYFSANALGQSARSSFPYRDDDGVSRTNTNSRLRGLTLSSEIGYKPDARNQVRLSAWVQDYYREIPPAFFEQWSYKDQEDASLRLLLDWTRQLSKGVFYLKSAFLADRMAYEDRSIILSTENNTRQYYEEIGIRRKLGTRHQLMVFAPIHISWIDLDDGRKHQSKYALAAAYSYQNLDSRLNIALNGRGEFIDDKLVFMPGVNGSYQLFPWLALRGNIQRTYRSPSLNELYYQPGGNRSLKPEEGWSEELGYRLSLKPGRRLEFRQDLSVFSRLIDNWILWFGGAIWTPHNISSVHSRGIETESRISYSLAAGEVHLGLNTSYVLATTVSSYYPNDGSIGKQLPYTPRYTAQVSGGFRFRSFSVNYSQAYTGYRFINLDESPPYLAPYSVSNVQLAWLIRLRTSELSLHGQVNNIFDQSYQVVAYRAMPGVNWLLGLSYNFR